jgi:hypothetical protein
MSTFLQLCQRLRQETGLTSASASTPTTVVAQSGQLKELVDWAASAYTDIQTRHHNWRWLRHRFTFNTTASDDTYAYGDVTDSTSGIAIARFSRWWELDDDGYSNVKTYLTSGVVSGEHYLNFLPWNAFRDMYKRGTQNNNAPVHFTVDPQNQILLGPKPDAIYTVTGEFQRSAQTLALDADTPEMPADYHMLVVWNALLDYAGKVAAPEVFTRAQAKASPILRMLEVNQLPEISFGGTLA